MDHAGLIAEALPLSSTEQRLLEALRTSGPFSLDALSTLFDMSWAQAFLVIDRLSRSRHVRLQRTDARAYLVSINDRPILKRAESGAMCDTGAGSSS